MASVVRRETHEKSDGREILPFVGIEPTPSTFFSPPLSMESALSVRNGC